MKTSSFDFGQCKRSGCSMEHGGRAAMTCRRLLQTGGRILLLSLLLLYVATSLQSKVIAGERSGHAIGDRSPHAAVTRHEGDPHASR